jgi:hypothetical protein
MLTLVWVPNTANGPGLMLREALNKYLFSTSGIVATTKASNELSSICRTTDNSAHSSYNSGIIYKNDAMTLVMNALRGRTSSHVDHEEINIHRSIQPSHQQNQPSNSSSKSPTNATWSFATASSAFAKTSQHAQGSRNGQCEVAQLPPGGHSTKTHQLGSILGVCKVEGLQHACCRGWGRRWSSTLERCRLISSWLST